MFDPYYMNQHQYIPYRPSPIDQLYNPNIQYNQRQYIPYSFQMNYPYQNNRIIIDQPPINNINNQNNLHNISNEISSLFINILNTRRKRTININSNSNQNGTSSNLININKSNQKAQIPNESQRRINRIKTDENIISSGNQRKAFKSKNESHSLPNENQNNFSLENIISKIDEQKELEKKND